MMHIQVDIETATQSKLIQSKQHIHNDHNLETTLDKLASDVLKSALDVYAPRAYCARCNGSAKVKN